VSRFDPDDATCIREACKASPIHSWNVAVQREITRDVTAQAAYVGTMAKGEQGSST